MHKKNCKRSSIAKRDAAFENLDELSLDNSYIVITNAANFQNVDLDVMKGMVILRDDHPGGDEDNPNHASFESGETFYAEGEATQVSPTMSQRCLLAE